MASNFEWVTGTAGYTTTPFDLLSTELNALADTDSALSSVGGTSGVFSLASFGNSLLTEIWFVSGGAFTPTTPGANIAGWWVKQDQSGNTETTPTNTPLPRPPDFEIPLPTAAIASGNRFFALGGPVSTPAPNSKVFVVLTAGTGLPATGNLIVAGPVLQQAT